MPWGIIRVHDIHITDSVIKSVARFPVLLGVLCRLTGLQEIYKRDVNQKTSLLTCS